jgi:hypothetical protein
MGAEPGRPNELSPITRIDTARVRPVHTKCSELRMQKPRACGAFRRAL